MKNSFGLLSLSRTVAAGPSGPSLTSLVGWYKDGGKTVSGSNITKWADQSGQANDLDTVISANPVLVASGLNGKEIAHFNYLVNSNSGIGKTAFALGGSGSISVFAVVKIESDTGIFQAFADYGNSGLSPSIMTDSTTVFEIFNGGSVRASSSAHPFGSWHVVTAIIDSVGNTSNVWVDGADNGSGVSGGAVASSGKFNLGIYEGNNFPLSGYLAEVLVYNAAVPGVRVANETYLKNKWRL